MDCEQSSSTAQKQRKVMWAEKKNSKGATLHYPIAWNSPGDVRSEKPCPDFRAKTSFTLSETRTFHEVLLFSVWVNKVAPNWESGENRADAI